MHGSFLTFMGIIVVLTFTPGADMALVARVVLADGRAALLPTLAGIFSGLAVHVTASITGLSLIITRSPAAFSAIRLAGAAYLIWLGAHALIEFWQTRQRHQTSQPEEEGDRASSASPQQRRARTRSRLYRDGVLTNLLNVKILLFYMALLPQFAPPGPSFVPVAVGLATIQAVCGFSWLYSYGLMVDRAGRAMGSAQRRASVEAVAGVALVVIGIRLALA